MLTSQVVVPFKATLKVLMSFNEECHSSVYSLSVTPSKALVFGIRSNLEKILKKPR